MAVSMVVFSVPTALAPGETAVENEEVVEIIGIEDEAPKESWTRATHRSITYIVAKKLGLTNKRATLMSDGSDDPDDNSALRLSHIYYIKYGIHVLGTAHKRLKANLVGNSPNGGSTKGLAGKSALYWYLKGNRDMGDWYTGYSCHYIQDVSFVLHTNVPCISADTILQALYHTRWERWIENNWEDGHRFADAVRAVPRSAYMDFIALEDMLEEYGLISFDFLKDIVASTAKKAHGKIGKQAWTSYKEANFPLATGTGTTLAAYCTKKMLQLATVMTGGTIGYSLSKVATRMPYEEPPHEEEITDVIITPHEEEISDLVITLA